jgi:hypothetical protein
VVKATLNRLDDNFLAFSKFHCYHILLDTFIHKNNMTTQRAAKRRRVGDVTCGQGEKVVRPCGNVLKRLLDNFKPFVDLEAGIDEKDERGMPKTKMRI